MKFFRLKKDKTSDFAIKGFSSKYELTLFLILFFVSFLFRFVQLGYSNFYGDETKTFYWNKTIPATQFFLDQRKGPVQFFVVWAVEKVVGVYDELWTRFPFALAGFLSVFALYFLVRKLFDYKTAFLASLIYSLNGFYIAFSRTIQYQSFLLLFGFLAIFFCLIYFENLQKKTPQNAKLYLVLSSVFLSLAFLCHYDAIFFAIPIVFLFLRFFQEVKKDIVSVFLLFALPLFILVGSFYLPYALSGFFSTNTFGYIERRVIGSNFVQNYSPYTLFVYNPFVFTFVPLLFTFFAFFKQIDWKKSLLLLWFFVGFIVFQFAFLNPGTHIHNYLIPLIILAAVEISAVIEFLRHRNLFLLRGVVYSLVFIFFVSFMVNLHVFIPSLSYGYPWTPRISTFRKVSPINKQRHLFLYGFPYNRGWDQVRDYLATQKGVRSVYTNDNDTIAEFYLKEYDYTPVGANYVPQYYIHVFNNQEFSNFDIGLLLNYDLEKEFYVDGEPVMFLYKLKFH